MLWSRCGHFGTELTRQPWSTEEEVLSIQRFFLFWVHFFDLGGGGEYCRLLLTFGFLLFTRLDLVLFVATTILVVASFLVWTMASSRTIVWAKSEDTSSEFEVLRTAFLQSS